MAKISKRVFESATWALQPAMKGQKKRTLERRSCVDSWGSKKS